jgi:hypothetical protein
MVEAIGNRAPVTPASRAVEDRPQRRNAAKSLTDKDSQALGALQQLGQVKSDLTAERKSAARTKLELARARLRILHMLGGNPVATARQAAEIAKEIAAAAADYAAAGGNDAGAAPPADAPTRTNAAATGSISPEAPAAATPTNGSAATTEAAATDQTASAAPTNPDADFVREARDLAEQAKALIEQAAREVRSHHAAGPTLDRYHHLAVQAEAAVEQSTRAIAGTANSGEAGGLTVPIRLLV